MGLDSLVSSWFGFLGLDSRVCITWLVFMGLGSLAWIHRFGSLGLIQEFGFLGLGSWVCIHWFLGLNIIDVLGELKISFSTLQYLLSIPGLDPLVWIPGSGFLGLDSWVWSPGLGFLGLDSLVWSPGLGFLGLDSWVWTPGQNLHENPI